MCGATHQLPQYVFVPWCLVKHSDKFALLLLLLLLFTSI